MVCLIVAWQWPTTGMVDIVLDILPSPLPICLIDFAIVLCMILYVCSAFTSEDQPRVKGPRTRRQGKEQGDRRTLRTVPEEGETGEGGGGGVRVPRGREPRSTSGSKSGQQQTQQFPTSRGLVSRPVRFA